MLGVKYLKSVYVALMQTDKPITQTDVIIDLERFLAEATRNKQSTADNNIKNQLTTIIAQIGIIKSCIRGKNYKKAKEDLDIVMKEVENMSRTISHRLMV